MDISPSNKLVHFAQVCVIMLYIIYVIYFLLFVRICVLCMSVKDFVVACYNKFTCCVSVVEARLPELETDLQALEARVQQLESLLAQFQAKAVNTN